MTTLIVASRNFANEPKIVYFLVRNQMARTSGYLILLTFTQHLPISKIHCLIPYNTRAEIPAAVNISRLFLSSEIWCFVRSIGLILRNVREISTKLIAVISGRPMYFLTWVLRVNIAERQASCVTGD
jgi:hypothetical protein